MISTVDYRTGIRAGPQNGWQTNSTGNNSTRNRSRPLPKPKVRDNILPRDLVCGIYHGIKLDSDQSEP